MKLIDKNKLLEELKKLKQNLSASPIVVIEDVESLVESLEVKEVGLENEFFNWYHEEKNRDYNASILYERYGTISKKLAKHFFELGINAQQKISYVPNIDDILKKEGLDPDSKEAKIFKESYYTAMEKLKAQKGE